MLKTEAHSNRACHTKTILLQLLYEKFPAEGRTETASPHSYRYGGHFAVDVWIWGCSWLGVQFSRFQGKNHLRAKGVHGVSINREICEFMRNRAKNSFPFAIERNSTKLIKEEKSCRMSCCVIFIHFIDLRNRIFSWIDTVSWSTCWSALDIL